MIINSENEFEGDYNDMLRFQYRFRILGESRWLNLYALEKKVIKVLAFMGRK